MLTLTRRVGQTITIGNDIEITVVSMSGGRVRLGVRAPRKLPVHRTELVERVSEENRRALAQTVEEGKRLGAELCFEDGLFGLAEHTSFVLCDLEEHDQIRCLMSCVAPEVQLLVLDAEEAWPGYPVERARKEAGFEGETAVALVVHVPPDRGQPTVNLMAPIVVDVTTRQGRQVVLDGNGLSISAPIGRVRNTLRAGGAGTYQKAGGT